MKYDKFNELTLKMINLEISRALYLAAINFAEQGGIDPIELIPPWLKERIVNEKQNEKTK